MFPRYSNYRKTRQPHYVDVERVLNTPRIRQKLVPNPAYTIPQVMIEAHHPKKN